MCSRLEPSTGKVSVNKQRRELSFTSQLVSGLSVGTLKSLSPLFFSILQEK